MLAPKLILPLNCKIEYTSETILCGKDTGLGIGKPGITFDFS
jgi:hypothetical protein